MRWERDVPLAPLVRYRIGGPAARLARPRSMAELDTALRETSGRGCRVLGTGANLLIGDDGVAEPVLVLEGDFGAVRVEATAIEAGAGARLPALAQTARRNGRSGFHFLEAVPGTLGGGLRMNAGSRDEGLWDRVEWAEAVTPEGELVRVRPEEAQPAYRHVRVPADWVFVRARLDAKPAEADAVRDAHLNFRERKVRDQVYDLPSVGSTWKNPGPPHPPAWKIVDEVEMRGARVGGARIHERHANFIVNLGGARAADVIGLMAETRRRALARLRVALEPEIHLWGFDPAQLARVGAA
ncbi:UDP-N-acetylmuramate dehydrogenase [Candidatus Palauibacter polyketidifaciens]|uniref:UDP-N-acetylmuramate dehydrogenase n=1 Tax=Candidatus Palauibacter polyketidifaciens TaxID=3056740 RepID=UPI0023A44962|nr:UDP-N-acetylmuramate dehydrogenase [Candidatus Palauibacter polyketidifaciens]MDE2719025.1 UDP-N-acetylmuramate dehydrogenase [Candidatus Palauibacter polyketidifaciens]